MFGWKPRDLNMFHRHIAKFSFRVAHSNVTVYFPGNLGTLNGVDLPPQSP